MMDSNLYAFGAFQSSSSTSWFTGTAATNLISTPFFPDDTTLPMSMEYHHQDYNFFNFDTSDFNNSNGSGNSLAQTTPETSTTPTSSLDEPLFETTEVGQTSGSGMAVQPPPLPAPPPKRSNRTNYCETVAVDSSAHVAQIVGKNGCKIKHLRAKYGTYIHTPSATDEPVFIIKGQRDKVLEVKQEIIKADNHFSLIKKARNMKITNMINTNDATRIRLFIPAKYIGLVVGRNGWFVKELQRRHQIYIETPKFDLCNYFQLYGQRQTVTLVKRLIYQQILKKTGISFMEKLDGNDVYYVE